MWPLNTAKSGKADEDVLKCQLNNRQTFLEDCCAGGWCDGKQIVHTHTNIYTNIHTYYAPEKLLSAAD